jgi:hypothetical protein
MKRYALACLMMFVAQDASAQHIRDMSLSVEDSMKQPSSTGNRNNDVYQQYLQQNGSAGQLPGNSALAPVNPIIGSSAVNGTPAAQFMDGYCDPNFRPTIADSASISGMQSCLKQEREQACALFQKLPADVKSVVGDTVNCLYNVGNNAGMQGNNVEANACAGNDTRRLQLLKKYWQDQYSMYGLVYLPDDVLGASGKCSRGGK